jgi:hypothetical protein
MSASTDGKGVHGEATATAGYADGVFGRTASTEGRGVYGAAMATICTTYGVYGESHSIDGRGVSGWGRATANSIGVEGISTSTGGIGVRAVASATTGAGYGVFAVTGSSDGIAVSGWADYGTGVYGSTSSTSGYGGYFEGDVYVDGSINKSACSFLIDHPLDPENKLLRHNCMESPEHLVVYRGKVRLDEAGEAAVEMPEYFKALAKEDEASIHLTPSGASPFMVSGEWNTDFDGLTIHGDPGRDVFWEVIAERDDPVIRQLTRPAEENKGPDSKFCVQGKLLHPTAYGYPESMGKNYERQQKHRSWLEGERLRMEKERARLQVEQVRMARATNGLQ